jgi:hypothetical protein
MASVAVGQLETRASSPISSYPDVLAAGDFNDDGDQDIALACFEALCGGGIEVLLR